MAVQEKNGGAIVNSAFMASSNKGLDPCKSTSKYVQFQVKELHPSADVHAPKVDFSDLQARKPYTITKQRERWTEEEHKKFLEALKLYGRAWRRIEEHIGSKTAVQIRSHAQKFFSKVVRESGSGNGDSAKAIEIPPPRPKRKPLHPYPRKLVNATCMKGIQVSGQAEQSSSPILSELENGSPTSVLSAIVSDTIGSTLANPLHCSCSPVSSASGSNPVGLSLAEQENGCQSSTEEVDGFHSPDPLVCDSNQRNNKASVESEFSQNEDVVPKEGSSKDAPTACFRLFGRTVLVTESQQPSIESSSELPTELPLMDSANRLKFEREEEKPAPTTDKMPLHGSPGKSAWPQWSSGVPSLFYCMQLPRHGSSLAEATLPLPWWALYGGLKSPHVSPSQNMHPCHSPDETSDVKDMSMERSWTGSNASSVCQMGTGGDKNSVIVDSNFREAPDREKEPFSTSCLKVSENSAFSKPNLRNTRKGFVPYKRCIAERDAEQSQTVVQENDEQTIHLCS